MLFKKAIQLLLSISLLYGFAAHASVNCVDSVEILFQLEGTDTSSHLGGSINSLGDINRDGFDDIAISSLNPPGTYIFYGNATSNNTPITLLKGPFGPPMRIDLDGDGVKDMVTADIGRYIGWNNNEIIYFYEGFSDSIATVPFDSLTIDSASGIRVRMGFVDQDSLADLLAAKFDSMGQPTLLYYSGCPIKDTLVDWLYSIHNFSHTFSRFDFIDFNGDGHLDICAALSANLDTCSYIYLFYGPNFDSVPDMIIAPPEGFDSLGAGALNPKMDFANKYFNIGDYDGDGFEDIAVFYNVKPFIYRGGPNCDSIYDYCLSIHAYSLAATDANADGYSDILAGLTRPPWGAIDIFLGGPKADINSDYCVADDALPPNYLEDIGYNISPAGDFDGDGVNDILFSCKNFFGGHYGDVFVISGSKDIVSPAPYVNHELLPNDFDLHIYPNPFNATATISFSIPRKQMTSLDIFNVRGQHIIKLLDKILGPGNYSEEWPGLDRCGATVSSGIYMIRLTSDNKTQTCKIILLK